MKVRIVYTILLLVFGLWSLTSVAQLATTEEDARNDRDKSQKNWEDADDVADNAYIDYNESDKVTLFLSTVKNDIELENRDNWEDLREGATELIADIGLIASSRGQAVPISSIAATVLNGISDIRDWDDLKNQLSDITNGLSSESANTANLRSAWEAAVQNANDLKEKYDAAYAHWLSFVPCPGCQMLGVEHEVHKECWNKKYGRVLTK